MNVVIVIQKKTTLEEHTHLALILITKNFFFLKCKDCKITSIYPKLNQQDINYLYDTGNYHNKFYSSLNVKENKITFNYLKSFLKKKDNVLDYGCGNGSLLKKLSSITEKLHGVDTYSFSEYSKISKYKFNYLNYNNFFAENSTEFDIIILRDVTEHLNYPNQLIEKLIKMLAKNGFIYIEGPAEKGFSIVNLCIHLFSYAKNIFINSNNFKPYHLNYYSLKTKLNYLSKLTNVRLFYFKTFETGWPYDNAGLLKNIISKISKFIFFILNSIFNKTNYGNRFIIILKNEK
ncbi:MAG: hypothetical protein CMN79_02180 [Spirochaetales bacterium]|nr:hypothetical protein [Spirochaetales bacterium]